jgi:hypothetical protein
MVLGFSILFNQFTDLNVDHIGHVSCSLFSRVQRSCDLLGLYQGEPEVRDVYNFVKFGQVTYMYAKMVACMVSPAVWLVSVTTLNMCWRMSV